MAKKGSKAKSAKAIKLKGLKLANGTKSTVVSPPQGGGYGT